MFELNGKTYSVSVLQAAATRYNMSYDEYLAVMKEKGLKEINQEPSFVQTTTEQEQQKLSEYEEATKITAAQQKQIDDLYGTVEEPNIDFFKEKEKIKIPNYSLIGVTLIGNQVRSAQAKANAERIKRKIEQIKEVEDRVISEDQAKVLVLQDLRDQKRQQFIGDNYDVFINNTFKKDKPKEVIIPAPGYVGTTTKNVEVYNKEAQEEYLKIAQKNQKDYTDYFQAQTDYLDNLKADLDKTGGELQIIDNKIRNNEYANLLRDGDQYVLIDNNPVPVDVYQNYRELFDSYNKKGEQLDVGVKKYTDFFEANQKYLSKNALAIDRFSRDYDYTKKTLLQTTFGFGDIGLFLGKSALKATNPKKIILSKIVGLMGGPDVAKEAEAKLDIRWRNYKNDVLKDYAPDISFANAFKNGNTGRFIAQEIGNQLPIFAFIAATGGAGSAAGLSVGTNAAFTATAIGTQSADKQYGDMTYEEYMSQLDDFKYNDIKYNEGHKLAVSAGFGLAEGLFGTIPSFYALRAANRVLRAATPRGIADDYLTGITKYYTQNAAVPIFAESFGEGLTQYTQNVLTGRPSFEGVDHAAFSGLMFGVLLNGAPTVAGHMMNNFATPEQLAEVRKNNAKVKALQQQKNQFGILTDPSAIKAIDEQIMQLNEDSHQIIISVEKLIRDDINPGDFQTVLDNKVQMEIIRQNAIDAKNQGKGQALIDLYQAQYDALQSQNDVIIGLQGDIAKLKVQNPARYKTLEQQAKQELLKNNITDSDSVFNKVNELYIREEIDKDHKNRLNENRKLKRKQIAPKPFETNQDLFNYLEKNNISITDQQRQKIEDGLVNGMNFEGKITDKKGKEIDVDYQLVSVENSIKNNKAGIVSHEGAHSDLKDMFGKLKDSAFKNLAEEIMQWTKNNDPKLFNKLFVAGGQRVNAKSYEEIVVGFLEQAGLDTYIQQPKSRTFFETITHGINRLKDKTYGTNSTNVKPKDAIEALIQFAKKLKSGEITLDEKENIKKIIANKKLIDTEQTTEQLETKNNEVYKGLTAKQKKQMSDIDNFVNMRNEDGTLVLQSNKDYSNNNAARIGVFNALNEPGNAYMGYFKNLVKADPSFANYTESELQIIAEELRDKVYLDRIEKNYNPNVSGDGVTFNSLFSFIYGDADGKGGRAVKVFAQMKLDFVKDPTKGAYELAPEVEQGPTFDGDNIIDYVDQTLLDNQGEIDGYTDSNVKQVVTVNQKPVIDENVEEEVKLLVNSIVFDENIDPESKDYKDIVEQVYNSVMMPIIRKAAGNFDNFFDENIEKIFDPKLKVLPIQYLYQAERLSAVKNFAEFDKRLTKQSEIRRARDNREAFVENEAQGVDRYKRKKVNLDFLKEYFGYKLKGKDLTTTIRARRNVLLGTLGAEATFDASPSILALSDLDSNKQATALRKIERVAGMKFSEIPTDVLTQIGAITPEFGLDLDGAYEAILSMSKIASSKELTKAIQDSKGQLGEQLVANELEKLGFTIANKEQIFNLQKGDSGLDVITQEELNGDQYAIEVKMHLKDRLGSDNNAADNFPNLFLGLDKKAEIQAILEDILENTIKPNLKKEGLSIIREGKNTITIPYETKDGKPTVVRGKNKLIGVTSQAVPLGDIQAFIDFYNAKAAKFGIKSKKLSYLITFSHGVIPMDINPHGFTNTKDAANLLKDAKVRLQVGWFSTTSNKIKNERTLTNRVYIELIPETIPKETSVAVDQLKFSETVVNLDKEMNDMIERRTGIESFKIFSRSKGRQVGEQRFNYLTKKGDIFIPHSAEDLGGFIYSFVGKGKQGDADKQFFKEHLVRPYSQAMMAINNERMALMGEFDALKKQIQSVPKKLKQVIPGDVFTYSQAVRVWIWDSQGMDIPDLSNNDKRSLIRTVENDADLLQFAQTLIKINKVEGYPKPQNSWLAGNIKTDLFESLNKEKRSKHLEQWQQNVDILFSEKNKNKMRAAYGNEFVANLEGILERMKTGRNRKAGGSPLINSWLDWINGSVGAIMFVNMRSAVLQTISIANYINWSDNNILAAGKAFANQKQYWADFIEIFNSDYLKERRGGLKLNVQESELAAAANKGGAKGVVNYILKQGFLPTRIADSFAISAGGATFFRNRTNRYIKEGLNPEVAQEKAFQDFMEITEETQQSSRPDRISAEQASTMGRVLLAFANTPMQYNRMIKRAGQDLINGRGDFKTNVSKIIYYTFVQNLIFNALQKAIFVLGFGDDEVEEKKKKKYTEIFDGMTDSLLRGNGISGQIIMAIKNTILKFTREEKVELVDALYDLSPPINSKISKMNSAEYIYKYGDREEMKQINLRNPALMAFAQVTSAIFNIPLDRAIRKANNIESAMAEGTELWQRVALLLGWNEWELGLGPQAEKDKQKKKNRTPDNIQDQIRERLDKKLEKLRQ